MLVGIDAALGVPATALSAARVALSLPDGAGFLALAAALEGSSYGAPVRAPADWSPARPFFRVGEGVGARRAFEQVAAAAGVKLRRRVEERIKARSVFLLGVPGQVGLAAQALWRELPGLRAGGVAIWPYDGALEACFARRRTVLAEVYPALCYVEALTEPPAKSPRRPVKSRVEDRAQALARLARAPWAGRFGVKFEGLQRAEASEDAFDALFTAAALLRRVLEDRPLHSSAPLDPIAEGGVLLA